MKRTLKLALIVVLWSASVFAQSPSTTEKKSEAPTAKAGVEITSDTQGVDLSLYLQRVSHDVKKKWYEIIPESAMPPMLKRGKVVIEFAILKNGQIAELRFASSSGYVDLDRAAYGGISLANPFPPLPTEFHGQYIGLRFTFFYNPPSTGISPSLTGISPPRLRVPAGTAVLFVPILSGITGQTKFPINWSVVGQDCGLNCGTISNDGMYTAPLKVPDNPTITVKATASADVGETASAVVTIVAPEPSQKTERQQLQFPKPQGWVSDFAKAIGAEATRTMTDLCAEVEQKTHAQIAVVTIDSTGQTPIADYAASLFNEWGIGHHDDNRGMLILLAISDHNWRIATGRGLITLLPDKRVAGIGTEMVPDLRRQRYSEALLHATSEIAAIIAKDRGATLTTTEKINATRVTIH